MSWLLWLTPMLLPLAAAVPAGLRPGPRTPQLLVLAPLPAGLLALVGPAIAPPALPWLLLDVQLGLDSVGRVLLALTALAWLVAGVYARRDAAGRDGYATWWLLSLAGNVGVILAADVLSFYTAFVLMTLAAYGLVVHTRTPAARRAGRTYLVLGVIGETLLLAGLLLAAVAATGLGLAEVAAGVAASEQRELIVALLLAGFGIKAGVIGLHVWLPLAHPAAPFAASAVLSGAMIKAGLVGWLRLLPIGEVALPGFSTLLIALGLAGAFLGVLLGLTHTAPKVLLAYSSVSQMGFITLLVGVALGAPELAPLAAAAAAAYALHHGLAKAVLFLGVGLLPAARVGWPRRVLLGGMVLAGLALAGAPASSGAFAKAWLKDTLERATLGPWAVTVSSLAATGTTLLMLRLLVLLRGQETRRAATGVSLGAWLGLTGAVVGLTPLLVPRLLPELALPAATSLLIDPVWPVALGVGVAAAAVALHRRTGLRLPTVPPGDLVVLEERGVARVAAGLAAVATPLGTALRATASSLQRRVIALRRHGPALDRVEDRLTRWSTGGAMVALVALALVVAFNLEVLAP